MPDYERQQRLGAGNFGEVWLVYDRALNVRRAVKYVPSSRVHDPTDFYKEPHTLMELQHGNIVRVEDAGKLTDGTLYIAMEYLPRGSIESIYRGRPLPLSIAFSVLKDVCWALEYAHNRDFIHRDIKPANILMSSDYRAKLSDFGLATRVPRGAFASPYGYLTHVAPEVLRTNRTSKLSDIYALGVTAYRLVNGDGFLPEIHDQSDIKDQILLGQYPDRSRYRPYVPTKVQTVINKCMTVDPGQRLQSAALFRRALEGVHIRCDWRFRRIKRNIVYFATVAGSNIRVTISKDESERYTIKTTKQVDNKPLRRVGKDCEDRMTLGQMKKRIRKILSRYVLIGN